MKEDDAQFSKKRNSFLIAILLWLGIVLLFFSPSVFGGKVIAPNDCLECVFRPIADRPIEEVHNQFVVDGVSQYLPYKWAMEKSFEEDGYVGWNPYTFNGTATPANTMASPGDWTNWLYAVLPFWTAWDLGIIMQFFVAGVGVILLLRYYKMPIWCCLLAAISFAFYSQFVLWIYHRWLEAMIWAPYLVWAMLKYKHRLINVPAVVFMALLWRCGHLQSCVFGFMLVACVWLSEVWKKDKQWPSWREFFRTTCSYLLVGVLGALLSLDVFVDTLPTVGGCRSMPYVWGVQNLLTLGTCLFPASLGVPQTMDMFKIFSLTLFDVKFGGGIVFILAIIACFNKRAPRVAKILFLVSFLAAMTPLSTYLYSRSTLIMALGMAWLAAWQVYDLTRNQLKPICWKIVFYSLTVIAGIWLVASIGIVVNHDALSDYMSEILRAQMSLGRAHGRMEWMEMRLERFLDQILIWHWQNLFAVFCVFVGAWCCYKIKNGGSRNTLWIALIAALTLFEQFLFAYTWVSYSDKPESEYLYNEPKWMASLREEIGDGSLSFVNTTGDSDFLGTNHFSGFGVRIADGYETFRPKYLVPLNIGRYDPEDYAKAGISHILVDTKWKDVSIRGWQPVMQEKDFKLYANPAYQGRYLLDNGASIKENWRTCNRIHLSIPQGSKKLTVLESYHDGWKAYADDQELPITSTERGGMDIALPETDGEYDVLLEFHMPYRKWYYSIMALTALMLVVTLVLQRRTSKRNVVQC